MENDLQFRIRTQPELLALVLNIDEGKAEEMLNEAGNVFQIPQRVDFPARFGITQHDMMRLSAALVLADKGRLSSDLRKEMTQGEKIAANFADLRVIGHEELWIVYLNDQGKMLRRERISQGDEAQTTAPLHLIARNAVLCGAKAVVVVHNHPEGKVMPSEPDLASTMKLAQYLSAINVTLLDHVIVGTGTYYSMRERKILQEAK